jgi:hypothetical protein
MTMHAGTACGGIAAIKLDTDGCDLVDGKGALSATTVEHLGGQRQQHAAADQDGGEQILDHTAWLPIHCQRA